MLNDKTMEEKHIPECPHAKKCGGCQMQNLTYADQLKWKQNRVQYLVGRFCPVQPIHGMDTPYHYRNKVQAAFGVDAKRHIISGVYQSSSHRIVPVSDCMIEDKTADKIITTIRKMMPDFKMQAYDERTGTGFLRHVLVKRGFATGQVMVVLVAASPIFKLQKPFVARLLEKHPEITTVVFNINDKFTSLVLGAREKVLYGKGYIEDELCGCTFRISPRSFYQINPVQTEYLYSKAIELAGLTGEETVLDAYCGIGTIGLIAGKKAKKVLGVELNRDAVHDAIANAKRNGIENVWFTAADAGAYMVDMAADKQKVDVVFMDPPRAGSDENFLRSVLTLAPKRVVYISCNPETLARDLEYLTRGGYKCETAQPVDMFPHTNHAETVVSLVLRKPIVNVNIDIDVGEIVQSKRGIVTYSKIKGYVLEQTGLKVSSLYIAQVKQKCGIIERESYNKPKDENIRVPQCPPEKEKAILEAFRHFGIIS